MGKFIDLTGQKFGRLTVIERDTSRTGRAYWICKCSCGTVKSICGKELRNSKTKSCGCYNREVFCHKTHGQRHTKIYNVWRNMRDRCFNPKRVGYKNYGGRGITVCEEWRNDFQPFYDYVSKLEHFGEGGYTLDRINVNGNYEPGNVRWATDAQQRRNRTDNHYIKINGEQMILSDVAKLAGVTASTIYKRISLGADSEQMLSKQKVTAKRYEINGRQMTMKEITELVGTYESTILSRIKHGATGEEILKPKKTHKVLPKEEREEVKRLYIKGSTEFGANALAKRFGVGHQTIRNIVNGK